jgi:hypothetical protein
MTLIAIVLAAIFAEVRARHERLRLIETLVSKECRRGMLKNGIHGAYRPGV